MRPVALTVMLLLVAGRAAAAPPSLAHADVLWSAHDWPAAAAEYLEFVDQEPKAPKADEALARAADSFKAMNDFARAASTSKRLSREYPYSEYASGALLYVAKDAEKTFDFETAISLYRLVVHRYVHSREALDAQANLARGLEALGRFKDAAVEYRSFVLLFPNEPEALDMLYRSAVMRDRAGDTRGFITTVEEVIEKAERWPPDRERIVKARLETAKAYVRLGRHKAARRAFTQVVDDFHRFQVTPADVAACSAAAEAAFALAEEELPLLETKKFQPAGEGDRYMQNTKAQLTALAHEAEGQRDRYTRIAEEFSSSDWTIAALYREGYVQDVLMKKVRELSVFRPPKEVAPYREQILDAIDEMLVPSIGRAMRSYVNALKEAHRRNTANSWSRLAMDRVCEEANRDPVLRSDSETVFASWGSFVGPELWAYCRR